MFCQHVKTPPPKKKPNFFSPASDCHKDVYIAICSPKKAPNFFSPAAGCHKDVYMAICFPQKTPNFFLPAAGCHKDVYMVFCPPPQKTSNFFRLRRAVTKICIWPFSPKKAPNFFRLRRAVTKMYMAICPPQKKTQFFFACGGLSQRCVYGHLRTCKSGTIYQTSASFSNSPAGKKISAFFLALLKSKEKKCQLTPQLLKSSKKKTIASG